MMVNNVDIANCDQSFDKKMGGEGATGGVHGVGKEGVAMGWVCPIVIISLSPTHLPPLPSSCRT